MVSALGKIGLAGNDRIGPRFEPGLKPWGNSRSRSKLFG
jgi:hypothetical protein